MKQVDPDLTQFVDDLWRSIEAREVAVFCGAGISLNSGLPLVPHFIRTVLERLGAAESDVRAVLDSALPFEAFVQILENCSDIAELLTIFELGTPNPTHLFLADVAKAGYVRAIATTNFDSLLEQALVQSGAVRGRDFDVLYRDEDFERVATDRGIRVIKVHGSIDDKPNMAIMLRQVAGRVLSDARRSAIGAIFGDGPHRRVLVLGYSCSDLFDLSPHIEALAKGHREVIFIDHHCDCAELRPLSERMEKNPFGQFPEARWALCDTDALLNALRERARWPACVPAADVSVVRRLWESKVAAWSGVCEANFPGMNGPGILGEAFFQTSDFRSAARHYQRALAAARAAGNRQRECSYLGNVANSEHALGLRDAALRRFNEAVTLARSLGDRPHEAMWLGNLAGILTESGAHAQAIPLLERSLSLNEELDDRSGVLQCLGNLGHSHYLTSDFRQAASKYEAALELARDLGDKVAEAALVGSLGNASHHLGEYHAALGHHEHALVLARQLGDRGAECNCRGKIAGECAALGMIDRAISELEQAIALARLTADRLAESARLSDLGNLRQTLGDIAQASEHHEESLRIAREIGHLPGEGSSLGNLGNARHAQGRYGEAIALYEQARTIAVRVGNRQLEGTWLGNLGATFLHLGEHARARDLFQQALTLASTLGDRPREADAEFNLGSTYESLGDHESAATHFRRAVDIYTSLVGADDDRTRRARERLEVLKMNQLLWIQFPGGRVFALTVASEKRAVFAFTTEQSARCVHALLVDRFRMQLQIVGAEGVSRATFESACLEEGERAEDYLFVYEGTEAFGLLIKGVEACEGPAT